MITFRHILTFLFSLFLCLGSYAGHEFSDSHPRIPEPKIVEVVPPDMPQQGNFPTTGGSGSGFPVTAPQQVQPGGSLTSSGGPITAPITATSVVNASVPSSAYTFYPATSSSCQTYSASGTNFCAVNNSTGAVTTNTDFAVLWAAMVTANATIGGRVFLKNGVYNVNSMTNEVTTGCSTFDNSATQLAYALPFPANTFANSVQWLIEGEAASVWQGEVGSTTVNAAGAVINITPTAVSSVTAGTILSGFWQRPKTNCTLEAFTPVNVSNHQLFRNLTVLFPTNTRGNECAFCMYFSTDIGYRNAVADFNISHNAIATGSAPVVGTWNSVGFTSSVSGSGNWQDFEDTYASGFNLAYDWQSEHIRTKHVTAIYNNVPFEFGRSGTTVFHPITFDITDQENGAGGIFGPQMSQGSLVDGLIDFELGGTSDTNWYSTARAQSTKMSESNCGYSTGIIRYQVVLNSSAGIVAELPAANLFTSCGQNIQALEGTAPPNLAQVPIVDIFTRPNSTVIGPAWLKTIFSNQLSIASNATTATSTGLAYAPYVAQQFGSAQYSRITIGAINAAAGAFAEAQTNVLTSAQTYYTGFCSGAAAGGVGIIKVVAGGSSTLTSQTATACVAGDTIELRSIPSGANVVLYLYRNGLLVGGTNNGNPFTDSSSPLSGGYPGIALVESVGSGVTLTKAEVGNLPVFHNGDSAFSNETYTTKVNTISNCTSSASPAVCGSASAGVFTLPAAATTVTVNTTAVTANSIIMVFNDDSLGTRLGVTCNTGLDNVLVSARVAGTSFTVTGSAPVTNPNCYSYIIIN
jgi:hypothetical protein